ncbi:MAG: hypothetical protein AW07_01307 [Candidatus Accumulibacter sp. SK-11]|nr:MAG: hypothetical protein AW07_01307 [Candidatus Accumulibacter sp. SK-11]
MVLAAIGCRVHQELVPHLPTVGVETLPDDRVTRGIAVLATEHGDEAAVVEAGHGHLGLVVRRVVADTELIADPGAVGGEALTEDAVIPTVLAAGLPQRDVTAVGQLRHRRRALRAGGIGIDLFRVEERDATVGLGGDVDLYRAGGGGGTVAVTDGDTHQAAGYRIAGAVAVGQVLDHRFHRLGAGLGVELDDQVDAVLAVEAGDDAADGRAAVAHGAGAKSHLAGAAALVTDAEVILRGEVLRQVAAETVVAGNHGHGHAATGEVGGIGVENADCRVDEHACRLVGGVLRHGDAGGQIGDDRRRGLGQRTGRAEQVLVDAVLVAVLAVGLPGAHPAVAGKTGDIGAILRAAGIAVQHQRPVDLVAGRVELLGHGLVGTDSGAVAPRDDVAAAVQRGDAAVGVAIAGSAVAVVDQHLAADLDAGCRVALGHDRPAAQATVVAHPADHEVAIGQHRHIGIGLVVDGVGVDLEFGRTRRAVGVHQPGLHAPVAAVLAVGMPGHDVTAVVQFRQLGEGLVAGDMGVDRERSALRATAGVVVLQPYAIAVAVGVQVVGVSDDEGAAVETEHLGLELVIRGCGVDQELATCRLAVGTVALGIDTVVRSVLAIGIPGNDETAGGQPGHAEQRIAKLVARRMTVNLELGADGRAVDVVALGEDAPAVAVLAVGLPDHHVLTGVATPQGGDHRFDLISGGVGVDALIFIQQRRCTVGLSGNVDRHHARRALTSVAVRNHHGHLPAGRRITGAVAVAQVLDDRLDRFGGRTGVELQHQVGAVLAVADQAADGRAAVAHHTGAGVEADLSGSGTLVADAEVILLIGGGIEGLGGAVAGDDADDQPAAIEVGRVAVHHAHAGIENLGARIDDVFVEADRAVQIDQFRRGLTRDAARRAEQALEDAVGVGGRGFLVVTHPDGDEIVAGEGSDIRVDLGVGGAAGQREGSIDLVAAGIEFLGIDPMATVARAGITVPADDETTILQGGDVRPLTIIGTEIAGAGGELTADRHTAGGVELATDTAGRVVVPNHYDPAAAQHRHVRIGLVAGGRGVDPELAAHLGAGEVETLGIDAPAGAVLGVGFPHGDEAGLVRSGRGRVVRQRRQVRHVLLVRQVAVDREYRALWCAVGGVALGEGAIAAGIAVLVGPGDDKAAVDQAQRGGMGLVVVGEVGDPELAARCAAVGAVALRIDAAGGAVLTLAAPDDDEAAVGQAGHHRLGLLVAGVGVDLELGAHLHAIGVVALGEDAVATAILARRAPDHHIAAGVGAF